MLLFFPFSFGYTSSIEVKDAYSRDAWRLTLCDDSFTGVAEGLPERKPPRPVNGTQLHSGETEILRKAVQDYFCFCYGKVRSKHYFSE